MTILAQELQTAYEATYDKKELELSINGKEFRIRPDALTKKQIAALFRYGKRSLNDSYNSAAKTARDSGNPVPNPNDFYADWLENLGETPTRGGGAKLSIKKAAWIAFLGSEASGVKIKGKQPNGANLDSYLDIFVKNAIWDGVKAYIKDMTQEEQRNFHKLQLPGIIQEHKAYVMEVAESDMSEKGVGPYIQEETRRRKGKKPDEKFKVAIKINPTQ